MTELQEIIAQLHNGFGKISNNDGDRLVLKALALLSNNQVEVKFTKIHEDAVIPSYAKPGDAGLDITCVDNGTITKKHHFDGNASYIEYNLGLAVEIPEGYVGLLFPRSSQTNTGLMLGNAVGVVDSGFRGQLTARFKLIDDNPTSYKKGDRVCQLLVLPYPKVVIKEVSELSKTVRGTGAWGSSGA